MIVARNATSAGLSFPDPLPGMFEHEPLPCLAQPKNVQGSCPVRSHKESRHPRLRSTYIHRSISRKCILRLRCSTQQIFGGRLAPSRGFIRPVPQYNIPCASSVSLTVRRVRRPPCKPSIFRVPDRFDPFGADNAASTSSRGMVAGESTWVMVGSMSSLCPPKRKG